MKTDSNKLRIGICEVDAVSKQNAIAEICNWIDNKKMHNYVVSMNLGKVCMAHNDQKLAEYVQNSEMNIADGCSIVIASKILRRPLSDRITGIELMQDLLKIANEKRYRVYFLGAKNEILANIIGKCSTIYPDLQIAGYRNGYFNDSEIPNIIDAINKSKPDILFVGMGLPQKEYFVHSNHMAIDCPAILPVGGAFDVFSGRKKRAPGFIQKMYAEWLWRSIFDPTRFFLILKNIHTFAVIVARQSTANRQLQPGHVR